MKMKAKFVVPQIDIESYKTALNDAMVEAVFRGAYAWLNTVIDIVPEWSGASRATFLLVARQFHFPLTVNNVSGAPNRVPLGLANSEGEFRNDKEKALVSFTYSTTLKHLVYNEYNNANDTPDATLFGELNKPGPYGFQEAGKEAFLAETVSIVLPAVGKHVLVTTIQAK